MARIFSRSDLGRVTLCCSMACTLSSVWSSNPITFLIQIFVLLYSELGVDLYVSGWGARVDMPGEYTCNICSATPIGRLYIPTPLKFGGLKVRAT